MLRSKDIRGLERKILELEERRQKLLLERARELAKVIDACEIEHIDLTVLAGALQYIKSLVRMRDAKVDLWRSSGEDILNDVDTPAPIRKLNSLTPAPTPAKKATAKKPTVKKAAAKKATAKKPVKAKPATKPTAKPATKKNTVKKVVAKKPAAKKVAKKVVAKKPVTPKAKIEAQAPQELLQEASNVLPIKKVEDAPALVEEAKHEIPLIDDTNTNAQDAAPQAEEKATKPQFKGEPARKTIFDDVNIERVMEYWS